MRCLHSIGKPGRQWSEKTLISSQQMRKLQKLRETVVGLGYLGTEVSNFQNAWSSHKLHIWHPLASYSWQSMEVFCILYFPNALKSSIKSATLLVRISGNVAWSKAWGSIAKGQGWCRVDEVIQSAGIGLHSYLLVFILVFSICKHKEWLVK
jgi:hypothetical protein